jgi:putative MATE family efflux protein
LLSLSAFLAVSMLLQTTYFLVDLYFVSRLGGPAIAGVGLAGNVMFVTLALTQMLVVGATTLIAQAAGRRDAADAQAVFDQSCALAGACGLLVFTGGLLLGDLYCRWLAADAPTYSAAHDYLVWIIPAFALQFTMAAIGSALRAGGVVKPGMIIQVFTVAINGVLAAWLIPRFGTAGAGMATLASVVVGIVALTTYFVRHGKFVKLQPRQWRIEKRMADRILRIGLPAGGEFILVAIYSAVAYYIIRHKGADAQAGFGVGVRLVQSLFLPVMAVSMGASPLAAQNLGARRFDRVRQTLTAATLLAVGIMLTATLICRISPETMVRFFTDDAPVVRFAGEYLQVLSWGFVFFGLNNVIAALFQAIGNAWPSLATTVFRVALFSIVALFIARDPGFDLRHVWFAAVAAAALQTGLLYLLLRREFARRLA